MVQAAVSLDVAPLVAGEGCSALGRAAAGAALSAKSGESVEGVAT